MLFEMLNQTVDRINALDPQKDGPLLLKELKRVNPDFWEKIRNGLKEKETREELIRLAENSVCLGVLTKIKGIPEIVSHYVNFVNNPQTDPAMRCALVGMLAMFVKPKDLIPDNAPGGYGFMDDLILLHLSCIVYLQALPKGATSMEEEMNILEFLGAFAPPRTLDDIRIAGDGMVYGAQILGQLPTGILDWTTQTLIQNPMLAEIKPPPPGPKPLGTPALPSTESIYDWGGGITAVEDGNVNVTFSGGGYATLTSSEELVVSAP